MLHESETAGQMVTVKGEELQTNTNHPAARSREKSAFLWISSQTMIHFALPPLSLSFHLSLFLKVEGQAAADVTVPTTREKLPPLRQVDKNRG